MESSPLGMLAAELRNMIYGLILYEPQGIHLKAGDGRAEVFSCFKEEDREFCDCFRRFHGPDCAARKDRIGQSVKPIDGTDSHSRHVLTLTQTCRQIRTETESMFFALNVFHWHPLLWSEESWFPPQKLQRYHDDADLCNRWFRGVGAENIQLMRGVVIEGPQWLLPLEDQYNPIEHHEWLRIVRDKEQRICASVTMPKSVTVRCRFDLSGALLPSIKEIGPAELCKITGDQFRTLSPYMSLDLELPLGDTRAAENKQAALDILQGSTRTRSRLIRSHAGHCEQDCVIATHMLALEGAIEHLEVHMIRLMAAAKML